MMMSIARLVPALMWLVWEEAVRSRRTYLTVTLCLISAMEVTLAAANSGRASGPIFIIGLWALSVPLCRAWVEVDVRQGYAAFWLQKPIAPSVFYLSRLLALTVWSMAVTLAVMMAALPATMFPGLGARDLVELTLGTGWMPGLLVLLSFLGSAIGVGNSALFAFALLLGGLAFPGLSDVVDFGRLEGVVRTALPPATTGLEAMRTLRQAGMAAAVTRLWPLVAYAVVCVSLVLLTVRRIPARLGRVP